MGTSSGWILSPFDLASPSLMASLLSVSSVSGPLPPLDLESGTSPVSFGSLGPSASYGVSLAFGQSLFLGLFNGHS